MRTVRCSGRLGGVCVSAWGVCLWGCLPREEGVFALGVYIPWTQRQTPPPRTEFLTHACENITFPQLLLRTVTKQKL